MTLHKEHQHRACVKDGGFKAELFSVGDEGVRLQDAMPPGYYSNATAREIGEVFLWVANRDVTHLAEPEKFAMADLARTVKANGWELNLATGFYVAAPFSMKKKAGQIAEKIRAATGWKCRARWLFGKHDVLIHSDDDERFAKEDLEDVRNSDVLVHIAAEGMRTHSGGRHVELGYALALGKHVVHIGQQENIFHSIVPVFSNVKAFLANDVVAAKAAEELMFT